MLITKIITTETAHRLLSHEGKCRYLHGHSYKWEVTIEAGIERSTGMVMDFSTLKELMIECIEKPFDHTLVLQENDSLIPALYNVTKLLVLDGPPTAEVFAKEVSMEIRKRLPPFFVLECVTVWETETSYAEWRHNDI